MTTPSAPPMLVKVKTEPESRPSTPIPEETADFVPVPRLESPPSPVVKEGDSIVEDSLNRSSIMDEQKVRKVICKTNTN